jgi:hypothetical protein
MRIEAKNNLDLYSKILDLIYRKLEAVGKLDAQG